MLVAERGVVCKCCPVVVVITFPDYCVPVFRDQDISIRELLEFHRYYGPLHKHATTGVPREPGLEEVHGPSPRFLSHRQSGAHFYHFSSCL